MARQEKLAAPVAELRIWTVGGTFVDVIVDTATSTQDAMEYVAKVVQDGGLIHFKVPHVGFIAGSQVTRVQFLQVVHPR